MTTYTAPTQTFDSADPWQPNDSWSESPVDDNGHPTGLGSPLDPQIHDNATTSFHEASGEGVNRRPDRFRVSLNNENMDFVVPWDQMLPEPPPTPINEETPEVGGDCQPPGRTISIRSYQHVSTKVWFKVTKCWIIVNVQTEFNRLTNNYVCRDGTWEEGTDFSEPFTDTRTSRFATCRPRPA